MLVTQDSSENVFMLQNLNYNTIIHLVSFHISGKDQGINIRHKVTAMIGKQQVLLISHPL